MRTHLQCVLLARKVFVQPPAELRGVQEQLVVGHGQEHFVDLQQVVRGTQ